MYCKHSIVQQQEVEETVKDIFLNITPIILTNCESVLCYIASEFSRLLTTSLPSDIYVNLLRTYLWWSNSYFRVKGLVTPWFFPMNNYILFSLKFLKIKKKSCTIHNRKTDLKYAKQNLVALKIAVTTLMGYPFFLRIQLENFVVACKCIFFLLQERNRQRYQVEQRRI